MMEINKRNIRTWSMLGPRAVYGLTILDLVEKNDSIFALSADLGGSSGLKRLIEKYPEHYLNTGIAEQDLIGVCAGLSNEGLIPFATSFAPFITHRCADQIRMNMGYMHQNIKLTGLGSGVSMSILGNSHYGLEDISFLRAIPNMVILSPCDCLELVKCIEKASIYDGPVYIRMTGEPNMPIVYEDDFDFSIGNAKLLKKGQDICIIATGSMVYYSIKAAELLENEDISVTVIDMHTIKPLDKLIIDTKKYKLFVTVEEHNIIGGLGSTIAEYITECNIQKPLLRIGINDEYPVPGSYNFMLKNLGLTAEGIYNRIIKIYSEL